MKKIKLQFLSLIILVFIFTSCEEKLENVDFIGKWNSYITSLELNENGDFLFSNFDSGFTLKGQYELSGEFDSIYLNTEYFSLVFNIDLVDGKLITWNYKGSKSTMNHIDEVVAYSRDKKFEWTAPEGLTKEIYLLSDNYRGNVYVSFDQKWSGNIGIDKDGNRMMDIPSFGQLKTEFSVSVPTLAFCNYEFYQNKKRIPVYIEGMINESNKHHYNMDSVYVCVKGYNQRGRSDIDFIFGEKITNDVFMFEVDTLRNLIK